MYFLRVVPKRPPEEVIEIRHEKPRHDGADEQAAEGPTGPKEPCGSAHTTTTGNRRGHDHFRVARAFVTISTQVPYSGGVFALEDAGIAPGGWPAHLLSPPRAPAALPTASIEKGGGR